MKKYTITFTTDKSYVIDIVGGVILFIYTAFYISTIGTIIPQITIGLSAIISDSVTMFFIIYGICRLVHDLIE